MLVTSSKYPTESGFYWFTGKNTTSGEDIDEPVEIIGAPFATLVMMMGYETPVCPESLEGDWTRLTAAGNTLLPDLFQIEVNGVNCYCKVVDRCVEVTPEGGTISWSLSFSLLTAEKWEDLDKLYYHGQELITKERVILETRRAFKDADVFQA